MQWKKSGELVVIFISGHRNCEPCSKKEKVHLFSTVHKLNCFVASGQSQSHTEHTGNPLLHASEDGMSTEGAQLSLHIKHTWSTTYIVCPGKKVIWQGCAFQRPCICKDNFYVFWCFCLFFFFSLQQFGSVSNWNKWTEKWLSYAHSVQLEQTRVSHKCIFWPFRKTQLF